MAKTVTRGFLFYFALISSFASASLVPMKFPSAVVALGSMQPVMLPGQPCIMRWTTEGTGFLYGYLTQPNSDPIKRMYEVYLVTNRHVIEDHATALATSKSTPQPPQLGAGCSLPPATENSISIRMNPQTSSREGRQFDLPIKDWFFHPNRQIDIAAFRLNPQFFKTEGFLDLFFTNDGLGANKDKIKSKGVSAGDGIFVLGFPMNMAGEERNYVIVRQGCIARISDMLDGASPYFLVDAFIFPGNSGSPVILKPELTSVGGTNPQSFAYLIGIISSYLPYTDFAISPQTHRARVSFEENSGLAEVLPIDYIDEAITSWRRTTQPTH